MNCPFVVNKDPTPSPVVAPKDPTPAPVATPATPAPVPAPTAAVPAPTATPSILVSSQLVIDDVPSDMDDDALTDIRAALVDTLSGVREADDVLACDVTATTTVTTTAAPTAQVVEAAAEAASVISGSVAFAGLSQPDAEANKAVIEDGLARVAGVDADACSVTSISAARRRRLDDGAGVTVDYEIYVSLETAQDVAMALADAAADPTLVDTAIAEAAAAAGASSTFAACTTSSITSAVVAAVEDAYSFSFTYNVPYSYCMRSSGPRGPRVLQRDADRVLLLPGPVPRRRRRDVRGAPGPDAHGRRRPLELVWYFGRLEPDRNRIVHRRPGGRGLRRGVRFPAADRARGLRRQFDAQAECIFNSWTTAMGLDCDLDCAMTREFRKKRKLGVLDWARRLFSLSTSVRNDLARVIRRRAQDAALNVLARPSPKTKRRLDVSPRRRSALPSCRCAIDTRAAAASRPRSPRRRRCPSPCASGGWPVRGHGRVGARDGRRDGSLTTSLAAALQMRATTTARVLGRRELARGAASCDTLPRARERGAGHRADARRRRRPTWTLNRRSTRRAMFGTGVLVRRDARGRCNR